MSSGLDKLAGSASKALDQRYAQGIREQQQGILMQRLVMQQRADEEMAHRKEVFTAGQNQLKIKAATARDNSDNEAAMSRLDKELDAKQKIKNTPSRSYIHHTGSGGNSGTKVGTLDFNKKKFFYDRNYRDRMDTIDDKIEFERNNFMNYSQDRVFDLMDQKTRLAKESKEYLRFVFPEMYKGAAAGRSGRSPVKSEQEKRDEKDNIRKSYYEGYGEDVRN
jgi:hypothetical protein